MLFYPLLAPVFQLDHHAFGLWAGASIHEVAQVIGAGFQNSSEAGETATVAKLVRVAMLAPMVAALGALAHRSPEGSEGSRLPTPWFVIAFAVVVAINSVIDLSAEILSTIALITTMLLTMGLAAMGLQADISEIRSRGLRPLILATSAFVFIACFSLVAIKLVGLV
jgi:uncharacterized integral membrane protein (TIGR00698 family)